MSPPWTLLSMRTGVEAGCGSPSTPQANPHLPDTRLRPRLSIPKTCPHHLPDFLIFRRGSYPLEPHLIHQRLAQQPLDPREQVLLRLSCPLHRHTSLTPCQRSRCLILPPCPLYPLCPPYLPSHRSPRLTPSTYLHIHLRLHEK